VIRVGTRPRRRMREQALDHLRIARALFELGLYDGAASRHYYAAFQAVVFALERKGLRPHDFRSVRSRWEHGVIIENASLARGRAADRLLLRSLGRLRVRADYWRSAVDPRTLGPLAEPAGQFIQDVTA